MMNMRALSVDDSQLPLGSAIRIVGRTGRVATNDQELLDVLSSVCPCSTQNTAAFTLRVFVQSESSAINDLPHFRGLHHLVFATFGPSNLFVFDIAGLRVRAAISRKLAHDRRFWKERLLPIMVGIFGAGIDVLPLHAACVSLDGRGLLIAGASGTGKSTLSLALAKNGAGFLSDDWTYLTCADHQLQAHGLSAPIKLLPDAAEYFAELRRHDLQLSLNGELAYELAPADSLNLQVEERCKPDCLVFYERVPGREPALIRLSGEQARKYIHSSIEPLPVQLSWITEQREKIVSRIADLPCWQFRHSGSPNDAAQALQAFFVPQGVRIEK